MSEERLEQTAADPTVAEAARAELDARAEKLRASGWEDAPPDQPFPFLTKDAATDEQRASHREELRRRHEAAKARADEVLGRVRQRERDGLVFKTTVTEREPQKLDEHRAQADGEAATGIFSKAQTEAIGYALAHRCRELRQEFQTEIARLDNRAPATTQEMDAAASAQWNRWAEGHVDILRREFKEWFHGKLLPVLRANSEDADNDAMTICELQSEVAALRHEVEQLKKERDGYAG